VWARNGRELYYLSQDHLMAVRMGAGSTLTFEIPSALFDATPFRIDNQPPAFDVAPDGRFIMLKGNNDGQTDSQRLVVVLNWAQELARTTPAP
jgi:hypothetical protein